MVNFFALVLACSPNVAAETISAIVEVESSYNPYAIGVVGGYLERQPKTKEEAIATANMLYQLNYNFSMGLAQVNLHNLPRYNITIEEAFDPCTNLRVGALILEECFLRAANQSGDEQEALRKAFSCYYSGNFIRGFKPDSPKTISYVDKVLSAAKNRKPTIPKIKFTGEDHISVPLSVVSNSKATTPIIQAPKRKTSRLPQPRSSVIHSDSVHDDQGTSILYNPHFSSSRNGTQVF